MALHFNYKNVADQSLIEDPTDKDRYHPVFDALIWLSLSCGYNEITKNNAAKVYLRVKTFQLVSGAYFRKRQEGTPGIPVYITQADVDAYIGLTTNASTMTDSAFAKRVMEWAKDSTKARNEGAPEPSAIAFFAGK